MSLFQNTMNLPPHSVLLGHCVEVNSQCLGLVFSGHCEFTSAQCPGTQTEVRNSNTETNLTHTKLQSKFEEKIPGKVGECIFDS